MKRLFLIIWLLIIAPSSAFASTWYAGTGGLNTNTCEQAKTLATRKLTIAAGVACMTAEGGSGHTLYITAGTYSEAGITAVPSGSGSGATFTSPNTIASYANDIVRFNTNPIDVYSGSFSYVVIDGSAGNNTPCSAGRACTTNIIYQGGINVGTNGTNHIRFKGIEVDSAKGSGSSCMALFGSGGGHQVINSKLHGCGTYTGGTPQDHGMYITSPNNIVDGNYIYSNIGACIQVYRGSGGTGHENDGTILRNNECRGNGTAAPIEAIILGDGIGGMSAYNNIVVNNTGGGILAYQNSTGAQIYNNTVYGNSGAGLYLWDGGGTPSGTIWRNNIASNNGTNIYFTAGTVTRSNNLCSAAGTYCDTVGAVTSEAPATTFENPGTDFRLKTGSVAINGGTINIAPLVNIPACSGLISTNCYNGSAPDLGALETGVPVTGGPPALTMNTPTVSPGGTILLTVDDDDVNQRTELTGDWIGILPTGAANYDQSPLDYFFMNNMKVAPTSAISNAVLTFTAPAAIGTYDFVFYPGTASQADQYIATATFNVVTPGIVLQLSSSTLKIGPGVTLKVGTP